MAEKKNKRVTLTLSLSNPIHEEAWRILQGIPKGRRTAYICKCLTESERALGTVIYDSVARALREYGTIPLEKTNRDREAGEVAENFFGFLDSLQKEGGE